METQILLIFVHFAAKTRQCNEKKVFENMLPFAALFDFFKCQGHGTEIHTIALPARLRSSGRFEGQI